MTGYNKVYFSAFNENIRHKIDVVVVVVVAAAVVVAVVVVIVVVFAVVVVAVAVAVVAVVVNRLVRVSGEVRLDISTLLE